MNPQGNADAPGQAAPPGPRTISEESKDRLLKLFREVMDIKNNCDAEDDDIVAVVVNGPSLLITLPHFRMSSCSNI
jgi:hypothetical protein